MSTWIPIYVVELDSSSSSTRSDIRIRSTSCPEFRFIILPIPCPSLDWALAILGPSYSFLQLLLRIHIRSQLHLGIKLPFSLSSRPLSLNIYLLTTFNLFHLLPPTHWLTSIPACLLVCQSVPEDMIVTHIAFLIILISESISSLFPGWSLSRAIWCGNWW